MLFRNHNTSRCELFFLWRHLPPQHLQISRDARILRLLVQCTGKPAISGRQITAYAVARGVHSSENGLVLGVSMLRGRAQAGFGAGAILGCAVAVEIPFPA